MGPHTSPPNRSIRFAMYLSTSFSNSLSTTGATTNFIRPGSRSVTAPSILRTSAVVFLLLVSFQLPLTWALPIPGPGF